MKVGIPKEIKSQEYRVGITPANAEILVMHGHQVFVESDAGIGSGFLNEHYEKVGVTILKSADEVFDTADFIIKVKEPQPDECKKIKKGQVIFTYLHLAPDREQTRLLLESEAIAIAYETVTDSNNALPLLTPMSAIAGRLAIQVGAQCLEKVRDGMGILMSGVHGTPPARVLIIGGGIVGVNAARMAMGLEANVTILDTSLYRIQQLDDMYSPKLKALYSVKSTIEEQLMRADLVIGAVLIPGAAAPKIVTEEMIKSMKKKSVLVDVAIDQGGCFETSKPTTHEHPIYEKHGVMHYCVMNMPSNVARTATIALNNSTLSFILTIANKGHMQALKQDYHLRNGLNIYYDKVTNKGVADSLGYKYHSPESLL